MTVADDDEVRTLPGARRPDRHRSVTNNGLRIAVHEWGDEAAPPLLLAHGGMDFAGTMDVFAPLLADAGWRVVSWDQRGHGDSEHASMYSWEGDLRDALGVIDSVTDGSLPVVGHSKGGALLIQLANAVPHRVAKIVNIDGMPSRRNFPDVSDHQRTKLMAQEIEAWLDRRRGLVDKQRYPGTLRELAERRHKMNPRLPIEWMEYLVPIGARKDPDGWRWKIDPALRFGGFGPWRPEWAMMRLPDLGQPILAILANAPDPLGWGTTGEDVLPNLPPGGRLELIEDAGHFVHIEQPRRIADLALEHLA
jgi:pimeloyl-ACP methyl ester carboxylesterase